MVVPLVKKGFWGMVPGSLEESKPRWPAPDLHGLQETDVTDRAAGSTKLNEVRVHRRGSGRDSYGCSLGSIVRSQSQSCTDVRVCV